MEYAIEFGPQVTLPVAESSKLFPVGRIYCVGRNYAEHAREMGHDPEREPPFFFMKPADAIVPNGATIPYPQITEDLHHEIEMVVAIGKGGAVIRAITEETGATIDIENDGTVKIASVDAASGRAARERIELITADVEVGRVYEGKVVRLMDFGAFVAILPGKDGLVHISQISNERVERVSDRLHEGDVVKVKVLEVDRQGRIRLSMRDVS